MAFQCLPRISGFLFVLCFAFAVAGCTESEVKILPVVISNQATIVSLVVKNQATGQEVGSSVQVGTSTTTNFVVEAVKSDNSRSTLSSAEFTVQSTSGPGTMTSDLNLVTGNATGTMDVTVTSTANPGVSKTFTVTVVQSSSAPIVSLVIKNQANSLEVGSSIQVGTNTSTTFTAEGLRSDGTRSTLIAADISVVQSNTTSGAFTSSLVFAANGTAGSTSVTMTCVAFTGVFKTFTITVAQGSASVTLTSLAVKDQATGQEVTNPYNVATLTSTTFIVEGVNSDGSRNTLTSADVAAVQSNTGSGVFDANFVFSANATAGNTDITLTSNASPSVSKTFRIANGASQAGELVQSFTVALAASPPAPGVSFPLNISGTMVGNGALTDRRLVWWTVEQGSAFVDVDGNVVCHTSGQAITIKGRALGAILPNGVQNPNRVVTAEVTFTSGAGSASATQVYPAKIDSFGSGGDEQKVYALFNQADISTDVTFTVSLANNMNGSGGSQTASLRREGNTWFIKYLNEGTWDLVYNFPGSTSVYTFTGATVMGDVRMMRDNGGTNEVMDSIERFAGVTRNVATSRMKAHLLVRGGSTEFSNTSRPGFRGPGAHTGGANFLPGYDAVDPYPAPVDTLKDRLGTNWWHFEYEFTPAANDTSFRIPDYHPLGNYTSPTSGGPNGTYAFTMDPDRCVFFVGTPSSGNFGPLLRFDPFPSGGTEDQVESWAKSVNATRG